VFHDITLKANDLKTLDYIEIASKFRKTMPEINTNHYAEYLSEIKSTIEKPGIQTLKPYDPEKGCLVTNLSRMPVHKLVFDENFPSQVFPLTVGKNAAAVLADQKDFILRTVF